MAKSVTGFSLDEDVKEKLQVLARSQGRSASAVVNELIVRAAERRSVAVVVVDGVRYVPARGGRGKR